jgi:hypothetical protein
MLLFAQEGVERMGRRKNSSALVSPERVAAQLLRYSHERLADNDYAPGLGDLIRLIQYRRGLPEQRRSRLVAGWVRDERH